MIHLDGLTLAAGDLTVGPLELTIPEGCYGVLLGPSGAGKSLVLEAVAGVRAIAAGEIHIDGRPVATLPPERRGVGLVFQDGLLFPHLSVAANIAYGLPVRERRRAHRGGGAVVRDVVAQLAGDLGVTALLERRVATLSGGERQRVALARALAARPRVLLLDEPLSAVDAPSRAGLRDVLRDVTAAQGVTVLHVTHDLDEALSLGGHCAFLDQGRLLQAGSPEDIVRRPASAAVARFCGAGNVLAATPTDDPLAVRLEGGTVLRLAKPCLKPAFAVIRAEDIGLATEPEGARRQGETNRPGESERAAADNELFGVVQRVVAGVALTTVYVDSAPPLLARCPAGATAILPAPGTRVRLRFPPSAVHMVSASEEG